MVGEASTEEPLPPIFCLVHGLKETKFIFLPNQFA